MNSLRKVWICCVLLAALAACTKKDEDTPVLTGLNNTIAGNWVLSQQYIKNNSYEGWSPVISTVPIVISFNSDGNYENGIGGGLPNAVLKQLNRYTLTAGKLLMSSSSNDHTETWVVTRLGEEQLELSVPCLNACAYRLTRIE